MEGRGIDPLTYRMRSADKQAHVFGLGRGCTCFRAGAGMYTGWGGAGAAGGGQQKHLDADGRAAGAADKILAKAGTCFRAGAGTCFRAGAGMYTGWGGAGAAGGGQQKHVDAGGRAADAPCATFFRILF